MQETAESRVGTTSPDRTDDDRRPRSWRSRHPLLTTWVAAFVILFGAVAVWTFATPLGAGPDEPAHVVRAAALVRGQLIGKPYPHATKAEKSWVTVKVPLVFASLNNMPGCYQFRSNVPAGCGEASLSHSTETIPIQTYVGRYLPFYYAIVGLPTLAFVSTKGVYGARLLSGALSAAMLALAFVSLRRCRGAPLLAAGFGLAVTPMALYLASVVNPSGLEISSAISAWVAAVALVSQRGGAVSASAIGILGTSIAVLILSRALAPLWIVFIAAAFFGLASADLRKTLLARRDVRGWLVVCGVVGVVCLVWDLMANPFMVEPGTPIPAGTSQLHIVLLAMERLHLVLSSTIGDFGWLDTSAPVVVYGAWIGAVVTLILVGASLARRRGVAVLVGTVVAWVVVPTILITANARENGILGQGRDFMGLAVGIPIVAAFVCGDRFGARRSASLRLGTTIVVLAAASQVVAFYFALRRNTVGTSGPLNAFASVKGGWSPPLPAVALFVVFVLVSISYVVVLARAARSTSVAGVHDGVVDLIA